MSLVVKIAQDGFNVFTCSDEELAFSTEWDSLKVAELDTITTSLLSGSTLASAEVSHGLGYVPAFDVSASGDGVLFVPIPAQTQPGVTSNWRLFTRIESMDVYATNTKLHIDINGIAAGPTITVYIKYYIFYNQLD